MRDLGLVKVDEPFVNLLTQGMVLKGAFFHKPAEGGKNYYWEDEVDVVTNENGQIIGGKLKKDGTPLEYEMTTMSKSKNNGVDPQELIDQYGADTARLFVMFASPPEQTLEWNDAGVEGAHRFLRRVWAFGHAQSARIVAAGALDAGSLNDTQKTLRREVYKILQQAEHDYKRLQYNTVVSAAMKMLNTLESAKLDDSAASNAVVAEAFSIFLRLLNPVAPHVTHVLWNELGYVKAFGDILDAPWPQIDAAALEQSEIELVVQVNGKLRGSIKVAKDADKATIEATALANEHVQKFIEGAPKKIIIVPGKLVNIVA
jgi:leucyl-tRNA synthetase